MQSWACPVGGLAASSLCHCSADRAIPNGAACLAGAAAGLQRADAWCWARRPRPGAACSLPKSRCWKSRASACQRLEPKRSLWSVRHSVRRSLFPSILPPPPLVPWDAADRAEQGLGPRRLLPRVPVSSWGVQSPSAAHCPPYLSTFLPGMIFLASLQNMGTAAGGTGHAEWRTWPCCQDHRAHQGFDRTHVQKRPPPGTCSDGSVLAALPGTAFGLSVPCIQSWWRQQSILILKK